MNGAEFTWLGALMVFWALTWRVILIGVPAAIIIGVVVAVLGASTGVEKEQAVGHASMWGQLITIPVYIYVIKRLFTKGFGKYRLMVIEKDQ